MHEPVDFRNYTSTTALGNHKSPSPPRPNTLHNLSQSLTSGPSLHSNYSTPRIPIDTPRLRYSPARPNHVTRPQSPRLRPFLHHLPAHQPSSNLKPLPIVLHSQSRRSRSRARQKRHCPRRRQHPHQRTQRNRQTIRRIQNGRRVIANQCITGLGT